jgi:hypothetical protein
VQLSKQEMLMPAEPSPSKQIDLIIKSQPNWKGQMLKELRGVILSTSKSIDEQVKWKMPSKPLGSPTWEVDGILCVCDYLKNAVRLTFPKGAAISDPKNLFNVRLDSKTTRAIDFFEGQKVNSAELKKLIKQAIRLNARP